VVVVVVVQRDPNDCMPIICIAGEYFTHLELACKFIHFSLSVASHAILNKCVLVMRPRDCLDRYDEAYDSGEDSDDDVEDRI
jgi:hypothetical protein